MSTPSRSKFIIKEKMVWKHTLTQHLEYMFVSRFLNRLGSPQGQAAIPSREITFFMQHSLINKMF